MDPFANRLRKVPSTFGLEPRKSGSAHKSLHTLDFDIASISEIYLIKSLRTIRDVTYDHFCILYNIDFPKPKCAKINISFRKIKDIDHRRYMPDVENADFSLKVTQLMN